SHTLYIGLHHIFVSGVLGQSARLTLLLSLSCISMIAK
ncbi:MAG: hypothetical protein ACI9UT_000273, partial [Flavobacteriales bacterium]